MRPVVIERPVAASAADVWTARWNGSCHTNRPRIPRGRPDPEGVDAPPRAPQDRRAIDHTTGVPPMPEDIRDKNTRTLLRLAREPEDRDAIDHLFHCAFTELRSLAADLMRRERSDHTLQPTALVNETYLKLFRVDGLQRDAKTRFLRIASSAMQRVLVDHARRVKALKRGGGRPRLVLDDLEDPAGEINVDILDLTEALERFAELDERGAQVVSMRVYGGLTMAEIAEQVGVTRRTVQNDWRVAMMWLRREFSQDGPP